MSKSHLLTEEKRLSIEYEENFDTIVNAINKSRTTTGLSSNSKEPATTTTRYQLPTAKPDADATTDSSEQTPLPKEKKNIPYNNLETFPVLEFDMESMPANEYVLNDNITKAHYVNYRYTQSHKDKKKVIYIGTLINIPEKGYIILSNIKHDSKDIPPKNVSIDASDMRRQHPNARLENDFIEALATLFAMSGLKVPTTTLNGPKTTQKPQKFTDAPEQASSTKTEAAKLEKTPEQRGTFIDNKMKKEFVDLYNKSKPEQKTISIETDLNKIIKSEGAAISNLYNKAKMSAIEDIASIGAMIRVETSGVLKYSPMAAAAAANWRVNNSGYPNELKKVVSGFAYEKNKKTGAWTQKALGAPWNGWNSTKNYTSRFKTDFRLMQALLITEGYKSVLEDAKSSILNDSQKVKITQFKEIVEKELYPTNKARLLASYTKSINLAIKFHESKNELIKNEYKNVSAFIHPVNMPSQSPLKRFTIAAKKKVKDAEKIKNSGNKFPYNFTTQKLHTLTDPGQNEERLSSSGKFYEIDKNPKTHGLRYVPFWVRDAIIDNPSRAFFIDGEDALLIRTKTKK
jgi:hypothetical protein